MIEIGTAADRMRQKPLRAAAEQQVFFQRVGLGCPRMNFGVHSAAELYLDLFKTSGPDGSATLRDARETRRGGFRRLWSRLGSNEPVSARPLRTEGIRIETWMRLPVLDVGRHLHRRERCLQDHLEAVRRQNICAGFIQAVEHGQLRKEIA